MSEPLAVLRVGMCSPVGLDAAQTASSLRAGVVRKSETALLDARSRPVVLGHLADAHLPRICDVARDWTRSDPLAARLLRLAGPPLAEALARPYADLPLPVIVAAPKLDDRAWPPAGFVERLAIQAERPIDAAASRVLAVGDVGLFDALALAAELLGAGRAKFVVVGGVDSHLDADRIAALERDDRLRTSGPQDAFTPGEAAAFVVLTTAAICRRYSLAPLAWISAHARIEASVRETHEGLAAACSAALAGLGEPIRSVIAGQNGERSRAREWGVAFVRNRSRFCDPLVVEQPAEHIGDAGAGLAPLMLATATLLLRAGLLAGPTLVWACAEHGPRGALVLQASR